MCHSLMPAFLESDIADLDGSVILPVAARDLVLAASLEFQNANAGSAILFDNFSGYLDLGGVFALQSLGIVCANHEHVGEGHLAADLAFHPFHPDRLAGGHSILFSAA